MLHMHSGHARLLHETATALLVKGGRTGQRSVGEACLLLAIRSGGGAKMDDACFIAKVRSKMDAELNVQPSLNLDAPYYSDVADLRPLLAVHEQHNRRRLLEHGLGLDLPQSVEAAPSARAAPAVVTSGLAGNAAAHPAPATATARATRHGPIVTLGTLHLGLKLNVPASEFGVAGGSTYAAVVSAMHSNGSTVPDLGTGGPICQLLFGDRKRYWFTVERVTVFARGSTQLSSPVAPDSEERQMHTPPERTPKSPGSDERRRASPVRRRDPRRSLRLFRDSTRGGAGGSEQRHLGAMGGGR